MKKKENSEFGHLGYDTTPGSGMKMDSTAEVAPRIGAGAILLVGCMILVIAGTYFVNPDRIDFLGFLFYGLVGVGFIVCGAFWFRYISTLERTRLEQYEEKALLNAAVALGGKVTVAEVVLHTRLSAMQASRALNRLVHTGITNPEVQEDGTIEYRFGGLMGKQKRNVA